MMTAADPHQLEPLPPSFPAAMLRILVDLMELVAQAAGLDGRGVAASGEVA